MKVTAISIADLQKRDAQKRAVVAYDEPSYDKPLDVSIESKGTKVDTYA